MSKPMIDIAMRADGRVVVTLNGVNFGHYSWDARDARAIAAALRDAMTAADYRIGAAPHYTTEIE